MCYSEKGICASLSSLQVNWVSGLSLSPPYDSQIDQEQLSVSLSLLGVGSFFLGFLLLSVSLR